MNLCNAIRRIDDTQAAQATTKELKKRDSSKLSWEEKK